MSTIYNDALLLNAVMKAAWSETLHSTEAQALEHRLLEYEDYEIKESPKGVRTKKTHCIKLSSEQNLMLADWHSATSISNCYCPILRCGVIL